MLKDSYPLYIGNKPQFPNKDLEVTDKYTGKTATRTALATPEMIDTAIDMAVKATKPMRKMPAYRRAEILNHCVNRFEERFEELAFALCIEAGKPIKDARGEVTRLIDTFRIAAGEATRQYGQYESLEISPRAEGYEAIQKRVPIGPCSFISPFNFPLNLVAHKVAPAIAAGCPFILKPASWTPVGALIIGEILGETDLPEGAFSIMPCTRAGADLFTTDDRLKLLSFTGSPEVGWMLKAKAGKKKVVLELGGNAACIVDKDADLDFVVDRLIIGAFYQSGQSCIGVQRIIAHSDIYIELKNKLVEKTKALRSGNPLDEDVFLGPIISRNDAIRLETWVNEASVNGANVLCGGKRDGVFYDATLLENVRHSDKIYCEEAFGPVAVLEEFSDFRTAVEIVNDSEFGLQAGVFTKNIDHVFYAWNELEVGGVVINDVPSLRIDSMAYGGVKDSGLGREGVRYAMDDMSEIRLMVLNKIGRI